MGGDGGGRGEEEQDIGKDRKGRTVDGGKGRTEKREGQRRGKNRGKDRKGSTHGNGGKGR